MHSDKVGNWLQNERWTEHINLISGFNIWQVARASVWYNHKIKFPLSSVSFYSSLVVMNTRFYIRKPNRTKPHTHYQSFSARCSFSYIKVWDDDKNKFARNMYVDCRQNIRLHCTKWFGRINAPSFRTRTRNKHGFM